MPLLCGEELQRYSQGRQIDLLLYGEKGQNNIIPANPTKAKEESILLSLRISPEQRGNMLSSF